MSMPDNDFGFIPDSKPSNDFGFQPEKKQDDFGFTPDLGFQPEPKSLAQELKDAIPEIATMLKASLVTGPEFTPQQMALERPAFFDPRVDKSDTASLTKGYVPVAQAPAPLPEAISGPASATAAGFYEPPVKREAILRAPTDVEQYGQIRGVGTQDVGLARRVARDVGTAAGTMTTGTGQVLKMAGKGYENLGLETVGKYLEKTGQAVAGKGRELTSKMQMENPTAFDALVQGITSTGTFFIPGLGVSKVGQALSFAPKVAEAFGIAASSLMESSIEAGLAREEAINNGQTEEAADRIASKVFMANIPITALGNKLGLFGNAKSIPGKFAQAYIAEGGQEALQKVASNIPSGKEAMAGTAQDFLIGGLAGGIVGGATQALSSPSEGTMAERATPAPEQGKAIPAAQAEGVAAPVELPAQKMNEILEQGVKKASEVEAISTPEQVGKKFGFNVEINPQADVHGSEWSAGGKKLVVGSDITPSKYFSADWTKGGGKDFVSSADIPNNVKSAYHEAAHGLFSKNPEKGHIAINELKKLGVPSEQSFESLVDMGGLYLSEPSAITNPSVKKILDNWIGEYAQKTGTETQGAGQEVAPPEGQGAGIPVRDVAKDGVEAAEGEVGPAVPTEPPPPTPPTAEATPPAPMSDEELIAKVRTTLAKAKPEVALQKISYSEQLAKRFGAAKQAYALAGGGKAGFEAGASKLAGELEKLAFEEIHNLLAPEEVARLYQMLGESINLKTFGDQLSAKDGLDRMLSGRLPQKAQIAKLEKVFGRELVEELEKKRSSLAKMYDMGLQLINIPRSLMASMDLSAPFRQGVFFVSRPEFWGKAWPDMIRSMKSEQAFNDLQLQIENDPDYLVLKEAGLDITGMSTVADREEDFQAPLLERAFKVAGVDVNVPGRLIRASGRAYVGFLNKLRLDVAKSMMKSAQDAGYTPTQDLVEKIVKYVNAGTGRGGLGPLQGAANALNTVFFSPRLMASRVNLMTKILQLSFYEKNNAFIRQQYWRDAFSFVALGSTVLGLAKLAGADVGDDPRSSDFGKIKIGNTRLDIWGGFQQYARMIGQMWAGEMVSSVTGRVLTLGEGYKPYTYWDIGERQFASKLSPVASFVRNMMKQQDWEGKPVTLKNEIQSRIYPLAVGDIVKVAMENPKLLPISALGIVGFGSQTYGGDKPVDYAKMSKTMSFGDIVKTLESVEDPKARKQLYRAGLKKLPGAIRKAEDKEAVKKLLEEMVRIYRNP